ncbi:MAG: hypothetical protein CTY15_09280 [Methylocystis sp.]|nr:MAG: hypothetical protein CTY15_09280 [Methylocystis sp.]
MLGAVPADNDELPLAVQVEHVDDIQTPSGFLAAGRANSSSEQQADDVEHEKRGEKERHDCPEDRKQF